MNKKPHIVIFNPDQWRGDVLHHMGDAGAVTPNLDAIIQRDAVSFRNAFCQSPACTPSRCSFTSGWYPHVRGHRTMTHLMQPDEPVLLRTLKQEGYDVWWGGKNDLVPADNGFEEYCTEKFIPPPTKPRKPGTVGAWRGAKGSNTFYSFYHGRAEIGDIPVEKRAGDWAYIHGAIEKIRNHDAEKPLCIYLALSFPHPPYGVEDPWYSMIDCSRVHPRIPTPDNWQGFPSFYPEYYKRSGMTGWTEEQWMELKATYYGMCARVDHQFGMLVDALKAAGIYDDTALFFFSDHGDFTGDYGLVQKAGNVFPDCLVRVPFIVKPPAAYPIQTGINEALVELIDMPATVEELTGIIPGHTHFGRSLLPLIAGKITEHRDAVFSEGGRLYEEDQCKDIGGTKFPDPTDSLYWPTASILEENTPAVTKAVMCRTRRYKYVMRYYEQDELYDLETDPGETNNRIDDPSLAAALAEMKDRLLTFYLGTGDVVPFRKDRQK